MLSLRDYSIKVKLIMVVLLVTVLSLVLSSIAYIVNERQALRDDLIQNTGLVAAILAENCISAVSFDDPETAEEALRSIENDPHLIQALILLPDGSTFASHACEDAVALTAGLKFGEEQFLLQDDYLIAKQPVMEGNKQLGTLLVQSNLEKAAERTASFVKTSLIISLLTALVGLVIATLFQRVITRPIKEIEAGARHLAVGDLDLHITYRSRDEIGRLAEGLIGLRDYMRDLSGAAKRVAANDLTVKITPRSEQDVLSISFADMVAKLANMVGRLHDLAEKLVIAANRIAVSSGQMSEGAQEQADKVNLVTAAVQEMAATINQSTRSATDASEASRNASETAGVGGEVVGQTIQGMGEIANMVRESSDSIGHLAESADKIDEIVGVIEDIADQTNLLALNAAIEAARAGEQGRGFAVVADEVRKLAERTNQATGEIKNVIDTVHTKTSTAVQSMENGIQSVNKGRELADQAGGSLKEIQDTFRNVMVMIEQIATGSEQQAVTADEISRSVGSISEVTTETAKGAGEMALSADELNSQAESLEKIVGEFKTKDE